MYAITKGVITRYEANLDGGTVFIFVPTTGIILEGNDMAGVVLTSIMEGRPLEEIVDAVSKQYGLPIEALRSEIIEYTHYLCEQGVIEYVGNPLCGTN